MDAETRLSLVEAPQVRVRGRPQQTGHRHQPLEFCGVAKVPAPEDVHVRNSNRKCKNRKQLLTRGVVSSAWDVETLFFCSLACRAVSHAVYRSFLSA